MSDELFFSIEAEGVTSTDVAVRFEPQATIGDLADQLAVALGLAARLQGGSEAGLVVRSRSGRSLGRVERIEESDVLMGDHLALRFDPSQGRAGGGEHAPALLRFTGPSGRSVPLHRGVNVVGRGEDADITIADGRASRLHLAVHVGNVVTVTDLGSTNGTLVNDQLIAAPTVIVPTDEVAVGEVRFTVLVTSTETVSNPGVVVRFNRPPRVSPPYRGREFKVAAPPSDPQRPRLPLIAATLPLLLGLVMWLFTRNLLSVIFIGLSPLMVLGNFVEQRRGTAADHRALVTRWKEKLDRLRWDLAAEHAHELDRRRREAPPITVVLQAAESRNHRLWERAPGDPDFLHARIGLADLPSRITVKIDDGGSETLRAEAEALVDDYATAPSVPLTVGLADGPVGIIGPYRDVLVEARRVVMEALTLHSPSELRVWALLGEAVVADWEWLKWMPHCRIEGATTLSHDRATSPAAMSRIESIVPPSADEDGDSPRLPRHLVVVDQSTPVELARLITFLRGIAGRGIGVVWVGRDMASLPRPCRWVFELGNGESARLADSVTGEIVEDIVLDAPFDVRSVDRILASAVDAGYVDAGSNLPGLVTLPELLGSSTDVLDDRTSVRERWEESRSNARSPEVALSPLLAPVGRIADAPFALDLRRDGPHALVAGTTGAGKSEFLQTWVLALAATHPPDRLTFLFVDYKGGAAFRSCILLPHSVGLVTDLDAFQVRRALTSLEAELHRREVLINEVEAKDLIDMEKKGHPSTPPNLVIVIDEFAALAREVPEFVDGVVDIAQRGRSLGIHLILATQRPQGVINDNIRANTNLRIALRMADAVESMDVVGSKTAAMFDRSTPGRAVARIGATPETEFQSGFAGAVSGDGEQSDPLRLGRFDSGEIQYPDVRARASKAEPDIDRLVATIRGAWEIEERESPKHPWQDPLPPRVDLERLPRGTDTAVYLGVRDVPRRQTRDWSLLEPEREGSYLVAGTSGSGKTGFLRALVAALGNTAPGTVEVYVLDFAGRGMQMVESLPFVGGVIAGGDHERVIRLLRHLEDVIERRGELMASRQAGSLSEMRRSGSDERRVFVLIDGIGAMSEAFESVEGGRWMQLLPRLIAEGRQAGVHFVMTNDRRLGLRVGLTSNVSRVMTLRLASRDDYLDAGVDPDAFNQDTPPGRGFDGGYETQFAIPSGSAEVGDQAMWFESLKARLDRSGVSVPAIGRLPDRVTADAALTQASAIGIRDSDLAPIALPEALKHFAVFGPSGSGKTTALETVAMAMSRRWPGRVVGVSTHGSLTSPVFDKVFTDMAEAAALLTEDSGEVPLALFVDDALDVLDGELGMALANHLRAIRGRPGFVALAADAGLARRTFADALTEVRAAKNGLLIAPDFVYDGDLLGTSIRPVPGRSFPPGRGFAVVRGVAELVQIAIHEPGGQP